LILTAHQPVYFPWLGLFHKIALSDKFVFFDEVQYLPRDWMNRNKIKTPNGEMWLTVPVFTKGHREKKTSEIEINNQSDWKNKHLKSIKNNYNKSQFFADYIPFFEELYSKNWSKLTELTEYMLKWFLQELNIKTEFVKASDFQFDGTKSDLVLDMCKTLKAHTYIFGIRGKDYAKLNDFKNEKISVIFQNYNHPTYKQNFGTFIPNLSIIDLLFNCGPQSKKILMSQNMTKDQLNSNI
tara:strand:+ start:1036 stop:1752 length:717 start_codon:yes stop_codon:yes gene_type:complete